MGGRGKRWKETGSEERKVRFGHRRSKYIKIGKNRTGIEKEQVLINAEQYLMDSLESGSKVNEVQ